jgi:hypothetical protein
MKWLFALVMVLAGAGLGSGVAYFQDKDPGEDFRAMIEAASYAPKRGHVSPRAPVETERPKIVVENGREYGFGVMDVGENQRHTFLVRNDGNLSLEMKLVRTTCKCAIGELPDDAIAPGEVGDVTLDWKAENYQREFRQSATIETNDPHNPLLILSVFGRVVQSVNVVPTVLTLGDATVDDQRKATLSLQAYKDADLKIESYQWVAPDLAEFLDVDWEPAQEADGAACAYNVNVRLKPGMPHGRFKETLLLKLSSSPKRIEIPVSGRIVSDISIVGKNFSERTGVLRMGIVQQDRGSTAGLLILVKGPHREQVVLSKQLIDPDGGLDVRIGEPTKYETVVKYPVEIVVPPDSEVVQRRTTEQNPGRIVLKTTHPGIEQVEILVSYAVVDQ